MHGTDTAISAYCGPLRSRSDGPGKPYVASAWARGGRVVSRTTRLEGHPEAWASGSASAWLAALIDRYPAALELGGDGALASALIAGLHEQLFAGSGALSP